MIDIIITSYNEPKSTLKAAKAFLDQSKSENIRLTVVDPFPAVEEFLRKEIKDKRFNFFLDPGEGKSYALNLLFQEYGSQNSEDIFILTDGDVFVSSNAIQAIRDAFTKKEVGCITGKPVPLDSRKTKYGYWAHLFFSGIDRVRTFLSNQGSFFECSGYLFAIRKGVVSDFPLETSEDSIIPFLFWKKGYKIAYVPEAEVYVRNPSSWKDFLAQKVRNIKAHENLTKLAPEIPRTKSFINEIKWGTFFALTFARTPKEVWWTVQAYVARLYIYYRAFKEKRRKKSYADGWRGEAITLSTSPLDEIV